MGARRMADLDILDVRLYDRSVGTLTRLGRERIVFGFDPAHADDPERAALSLSFKGPFGRLVTDIEPTRIHAPPFFSNLLPEGSLREFLARSAGIDPRLEFLLLATLGEDLPGAVTITPIGGEWPGSSGGRRLTAGRRDLAGRTVGGRGTPDSVVRPLFRAPPSVSRPAAPSATRWPGPSSRCRRSCRRGDYRCPGTGSAAPGSSSCRRRASPGCPSRSTG